ncbi:aspartate kinase [Paenibacillus camelliae]|uniref:aspartate kinase n=1 Tax=Paenibacillus camelliae TaxID=512410 RepID=UPI00203D8529|nr:aspartate kinase [Paenibacillus camelliae]MCM3633181.1 aspartate kinase [Paenibacillus camelliae]
MSLIVMKFGGSSVGTPERMQRVAQRIIDRQQEGNKIVVVVSAMGDTTDDLIDQSKTLNPNPTAREMDMLLTVGEQISIALLSMTIQAAGGKAMSFTGWQAGMKTDSVHGKAKIADIQPDRLISALDSGHVAVVAGFQGASEDGEITTLGRGGSDTTAVALAAAIGADLCEIYTDVDGVYTTDPRVVKNARKLNEISYDEMLELAHLGAAVLHPRAVEYAKHHNVQLVVRSSFTNNVGTSVKEEAVMEQGVAVRGIAFEKNVARITIIGVEDIPGVLANVFGALADNGIDVDIIVQSGVQNGKADFAFTVAGDVKENALTVIEGLKDKVPYQEVISEGNLVKVSIVGAGMVSNPGVAAKMFSTISSLGVSINMVSTSEIKVSCVIASDKLNEVVVALHSAYGLDANEQVFVGGPSERR